MKNTKKYWEAYGMEKLMQYIWQHRLIGSGDLTTTDGRRVQILDPGQLNPNQGPDFFNAKIKIDNALWVGNIEIHVRASDWRRHNHHLDPAYNSVILHVVERDDDVITRADGEVIPQVVIQCNDEFNRDYEYLMNREVDLRCASRLNELSPILITDWIQSLSYERMQDKSKRIADLLTSFNGSWEDVCYVTLARNLGFGINGETFERLARSLPLIFIQKHADSLLQVEALLFGQAGFLEDTRYDEDTYFMQLKREYAFLTSKFGLKHIDAQAWKFARMRPQNFPHRRIAMLAQYIHGGFKLYSSALEAVDNEAVRKLFDIKLTGYWATHCSFGQATPVSNVGLGKSAVNIILINTIAPLFYAVGVATKNEDMCNRCTSLLESLPPERNSIIERFASVNIKAENALESQALIQLRRNYCDAHKCMYCRIGHKLLSTAALRR